MQTVSATVKKLMVEEPYYGLFACGINKVFSTLVPTAAVGVDGINYMLYINEEFWKGLSEDTRYGVLKHELLHMCFFHITDGKDLYEVVCPDRNMLNIAMDLEVESYVNEKYWVRDKKGELVGAADQLFKKFPSLEKGKGTRFYINFLKQLKDCTEDQKAGEGNSGKTQSGGKDERPDPSKTQKDYDKLSKEEKEQLKNALTSEEDIHKMWQKIWDGLTPEQRDLIKKQAEFQMKETAKNVQKGDIPGELAEKIDELLKLKPQVFNWKAYFRRLLASWCNIKSDLFKQFISKIENVTLPVPVEKDSFGFSIIDKERFYRWDFGLGGSHGCCEPGIYVSNDEYVIMDYDVGFA